MNVGDLIVTVHFPDLTPADVATLSEAADALPSFGHDDLAERLHALADRVGRMLLASIGTARMGDADPPT